MKKFQPKPLSMVLFLAVSCQVLHAQPWSPLKLHEKFNFHATSVNVITNTIWTDSVKLQGPDSVFFLNRIVTRCDTCPVAFRLSNQPEFLKRRMTRKTDGSYNFRDPGSVVIRTLAKTGDTWLYDSLGNIHAQVVTEFAEPVFGITDSVKEILLSNGNTIRLSKNFGLLRFPTTGPGSTTYFLDGVEGRNVGQLVPKFREIYNFNPGDIFQYAGKNMIYAAPGGGGNGYLEKIQILSKDSSAGHYSYNILRYYCSWSLSVQGIPYDTTHSYSYDSLAYQDSLTNLANYYPNQIVENPIPVNTCGPNTCYFMVNHDNSQPYTKWIGSLFFGDDAATYQHGTTCTPPLPWDVLVPGNNVMVYYNQFNPGLGNTSLHLMVFEMEQNRDLIGYIKNGDTTGIIYPDDFILQGVKAQNVSRRLLVSPNPAENFLLVSGPESLPDSEAEIRDMSGILVQKSPCGTSIDISGLKPGFYFITTTESGHGNIWNGRFIKQ